ncbi:potassium-transporting ATPase subunit KdpB [Thermoanaerobacterium thermosaccharolyticum]|uniref:potassium-transporting ATPase subunit KdpB n=1 Tax=Thermoanaerobacterium thermosaccharolyticum TaxID=1517 RepID=UPI003A4D9D57
MPENCFKQGGINVSKKESNRININNKELIKNAFKKLNPITLFRNPVMFIVEIGSILTTIITIMDIINKSAETNFDLQISIWLWFTILFANFAESLAEGRGKAQADALRKTRKDIKAKKLVGNKTEIVLGSTLKKGDVVLVEAGDIIPGDGEVIEGVASVDESAITGESASVIRESGGDRSSVTAGTKVLSDWIKVKISSDPGESFLDKMIGLVEGAKRQKTPNEIALTIMLIGLTIILLLATVTIEPYAIYSGTKISIPTLIALLVCLIPTTIGGLLSAIGIAGMDRLIKKNILAMSGRAVEAAGDVDVLLLDKTGTITFGNRMATEFIPAPSITEKELATAAQMSSLSDETPEGRSIVVLAKDKYGIREHNLKELNVEFIPFTAKTRMSGININGNREIRKGAIDAIENYVKEKGGKIPEEVLNAVKMIAQNGGTPLVVAENDRVLGVIHLKDIVKGGIKERFADLRRMGIKTVMITGDNPMTAKAIADEAGVDEFVAEAKPETKLNLIKEYQASGHLVAMTGDGTNDAPALAQADVGVAMNSGTQAAKEAGNMVDLDSSPTKLIAVVEIGKQLLMTRGALTTFSIANDVAKYFAIIPAMFSATYPQLGVLNIMHLKTPESAVLSAIIFNALIIIALIPLALKGVKYRPLGAAAIFKRNMLIYGLGGLIVPFIGIKIIDIIITSLGLIH